MSFFDNLASGATWSAGVAFKRSKALPLDKYSVFETKELATAYAEKTGDFAQTPVSYPGQVIAVQENGKMVAYVLSGDTDKLSLNQIGVIPSGDGKTIAVSDEGVISLLATGSEAGSYLALQEDGTLKWVKSKEEDLQTAVEKAQATADDAKASIDNFLNSTEIEGTIDTLKEIQVALDALGPATELTTELAKKADKTYVEEELAKKQDVIAENTYDTYGAAAAAQTAATNAAIADADAKFAAIQDHATVDSFADVMAEIAKKQDAGSYATTTTVEKAQSTADEAKAAAATNASNITNINNTLSGEEGLTSKVANLTTRVATAEGTLTSHSTSIGENKTAAANAQDRADAAYTLAEKKATMAEVEAKDYATNSDLTSRFAQLDADITGALEPIVADLDNTYSKEETDALIAPLATTETLNAVKATAEQGVSDAAAAQATADAAKKRIDGFLDGVAEPESAIDTLVEIQQYMTNDTAAFTTLSEKVSKIEDGTTAVGNASALEGKKAADFDAAGAAAQALADAKAYADEGVRSVVSATEAITVSTSSGVVTLNFAEELILNGGNA